MQDRNYAVEVAFVEGYDDASEMWQIAPNVGADVAVLHDVALVSDVAYVYDAAVLY